LASELFPQYKMRPIPPGHILNSGYTHLKKPITVMGMSNGIRELCMLLAEQDPPRAWQGQRYSENPDLFEVAANIAFYASDKGRLRTRGDVNVVRPDPLLAATRTATLARIEHPGAWDPEPGGWRRMTGLLHNQNLVDLNVEALKLGDGKLPGNNFAYLTGMEPIELSDTQLAELRTFIARGGTLIVDAANGEAKFAQSIEAQLVGLVAGASFEAMRADDPIFAETHPLDPPAAPIFPPAITQRDTKADTSAKPMNVEFRRYAKNHVPNTTGLQLKGLKLGRRWAVILSPFDLSSGLVGQNVDGIIGYSPTTATEIVRRIIVNAGPKAPPPAPPKPEP
jgi:hypothetical protein